MKRIVVYVDASVVGGCEDVEFAADSLALWKAFVRGTYILLVSEHTLRELAGAPEPVRRRLQEVPDPNKLVLTDSDEADLLAEDYLSRGIVGPGSRADCLHVALATVAGADVLVSWNFKHIVNIGKIRLFSAVNIERGYHPIDIRSPKEVLPDEEDL